MLLRALLYFLIGYLLISFQYANAESQTSVELRSRALLEIVGLRPSDLPATLSVDSRFQNQIRLSIERSTEPLYRFLNTGSFGDLNLSKSTKLTHITRLSLLLEMAKGGNTVKPFLFEYSNLEDVERRAQKIIENPTIRQNAINILDTALQNLPKGEMTDLRSRIFNPFSGKFEYLALPGPDKMDAARSSNTIRTSNNPYVRPINSADPIWRKIDGVDKKFKKVEVYINGRWKEVLFPEISKSELAKWSPEKLGRKLSQKSFAYELPTTVVSFALSIYLYERLYAVIDQSGPNRFNERFLETMTNPNVWAVAGGIYGGSKLIQFGSGKLKGLRQHLKVEEVNSLKLDLESSNKNLTPRGKRVLKKLGRALFSSSGVLLVAGGFVGIDLIIDYRHYLKACSDWSNPNILMSTEERLSKLQTCEDGYEAWGVDGKVQQFTPLVLATASYFGLSSLGKAATTKIRPVATHSKSLLNVHSSADWHFWKKGQLGLKKFSAGVKAATVSHIGASARQTLNSTRLITPAQELTTVVVRGVRVSAQAGLYSARMVVGMFSGPVGAILLGFTVIDLTYDWWKEKIDIGVQVASIKKWEDSLIKQSQHISDAAKESILWELPAKCEENQDCDGTLVQSIDTFSRKMDSWRSILLRDTYKKQSDWIQYLYNYSSMFNATQRFYVDLINQIKEAKTDSKKWAEFQKKVNDVFTKYDAANSEAFNPAIIQAFSDEELPILRSEPLNGFGGPSNRQKEIYVPQSQRSDFVSRIEQEAEQATQDGRESDAFQLKNMKNQIYSFERRNQYTKNVKRLIKDQESIILRVANNPKVGEANQKRLLSFIQYANGDIEIKDFLISLNRIMHSLTTRDRICIGKTTEEMGNSRYITTCIFHLLIEKLGFSMPLLPGEAYIRLDADDKLSSQGIDLSITPSHSFISKNVGLAEYLIKQAVCGPSIYDVDKVIKHKRGWDLKFVPFRLISEVTSSEYRSICQPNPETGALNFFDPFRPVEFKGVQYLNAIHLLADRIDTQFLEASFEDWWKNKFNLELSENFIDKIDTSIKKYKKDVIKDELMPILGDTTDIGVSFGNYIPYSLNFSVYRVGTVPKKVVASTLFEVQSYFRNILDPIVEDPRHPLVSFAFVEANGYLPEADFSEREKKQIGKMNLYQALEKQYIDALADLSSGEHKSLTEQKNKYVYLKDTILDLETFLNVSSDKERNSIGINILSHDSTQFISLVVVERIKKISEDLYRTLLIGYAFDPVLDPDHY